VALKSARVATSRPYVLGGSAYFWGYLRAAFGDRGNRVEDPEFAGFVAAELRGRARPTAVGRTISDRGRNGAKVSPDSRRS
jgi:hypothetical protein